MKILLANIGNRNLKYHGNFIGKDLRQNDHFFEETKLIYENYEAEKAFLQINILDVLVHHHPVDKIYLFLTHQPSPFHQDTYYAGLLVQKLFQEQGIEVEILEYSDDPRDRDSAFSFFENFFIQHKELLKSEVYVSGSGGVPAMKEALNFYAVASLRDPHIVDVDENTHQILYSHVAQNYLKNFQKEVLLSLVEQHDYSGICSFLDTSSCLLSSRQLWKDCSYLHYKYNFNFVEANTFARADHSAFHVLPLLNWNQELPVLLKTKERYLVEFFDNLEIAYKRGEYAALLGKVFALKENIIRYFAEKKLGKKTDHLTESEAEELLRAFPELKEKKQGRDAFWHIETFHLEQLIDDPLF